ncbi:hypothetical protein PAXINDRAFT_172565 [Paxillus involutus ATCC 200175]|uniref:Uncharacterized protein n=1 Tax=Paxillus involutus ATCC 200175 TaxID=664439 RepID=A0A0C9TN26_PAXIN|nr:hypothetical protein PAXINDRAFT_172565 [Paxillus involutus ATCC 200175]
MPTLCYGYAASDKWLLAEGARLGIKNPGGNHHKRQVAISAVSSAIWMQSKIMFCSAVDRVHVPSPDGGPGSYAWCFTLASENPPNVNVPRFYGRDVPESLVPEASYRFLKALLRVDHGPSFYYSVI